MIQYILTNYLHSNVSIIFFNVNKNAILFCQMCSCSDVDHLLINLRPFKQPEVIDISRLRSEWAWTALNWCYSYSILRWSFCLRFRLPFFFTLSFGISSNCSVKHLCTIFFTSWSDSILSAISAMRFPSWQ